MGLINYDNLIKESLRQVVKKSLLHVEEHGLSGEQHFYITFRTNHPDVVIPHFLYDEYPEELTIVLQNQFWNLKVGDKFFSVSLSFNSKIENIRLPFDSLLEFADPSEDFVLQFEPAYDLEEDDLGLTLVEDEDNNDKKDGDNVVSLDAYRKNKN